MEFQRVLRCGLPLVQQPRSVVRGERSWLGFSARILAVLVLGVSLLWTATAPAQSGTSVTLAWNPSPDPAVRGYNVYSGVASATYTNMVSYGNVTNATVSAPVPGTTYYFSVTAVNDLGIESQFSNETSYTPTNNIISAASNTPPVILGIGAQTIDANTATRPLAFWVGDSESPATELAVSAASSDPTLVPGEGLSLTNTGTNWTLTVTPAPNQIGSAVISVTVCDTSLCTTTNFLLTVLSAPTIVLASPLNGASSVAPATLTLSANVTPNGHSISKVRFFSGGTLVAESASAPYSYVWNNVGSGSYSLSAQAVYDLGTVLSAVANVTINPAPTLPLPWLTGDVGSPGVPGQVGVSNNLYTISGAGNISGSADNFCFLYQTLSGDGEVRAQVVSAPDTGAGDLSGVMIRETLTGSSRYAFMGVSPVSAVRWQRRSSTGGGTSTSKEGSLTPPKLWVRLVRKGNTFYGYKSVDGVTWTLASSSSISMAPSIYVGLAVTSGRSATLATSVFSNVSVIP